mgnify:FL=1|jgi:hypothetical protein
MKYSLEYKEKRKMDKNKYVEKVLNQSIPPLIPYKLVDEYGDFINDEMRNVVRANCLRRYLEGAIDLLIKDKVLAAGLPEEKWNNYNLNNRIQAIGKYYSKRIEEEFCRLRIIGNGGSHYNPEEMISTEDINEGIEIATKIVEEVVIEYFYNHPVGTEPPVLTMLSSLPPCKRIYILERVSKKDQGNIMLIDKLAMAYLKNGEKENAMQYLKSEKDNGNLDEVMYEQLVDKIELLDRSMDKFDIAKNILDVARIFECLFSLPDYNKYPEFINIFLVLVTGYNREK